MTARSTKPITGLCSARTLTNGNYCGCWPSAKAREADETACKVCSFHSDHKFVLLLAVAAVALMVYLLCSQQWQ